MNSITSLSRTSIGRRLFTIITITAMTLTSFALLSTEVAHASDLNDAKNTLLSKQEEGRKATLSLSKKVEEVSASKALTFTDNDVLEKDKETLKNFKQADERAHTALTSSKWGQDYSEVYNNLEGLMKTSTAVSKEAASKQSSELSLSALFSSISSSHQARLLEDARNAVKTSLTDGTAVLSSSEGNVDSNENRTKLQKAIDAANGYDSLKDVAKLKKIALDITSSRDAVNNDMSARAQRLQQIAAQQQAAAARAKATSSYSSYGASRSYGTSRSSAPSRSYGRSTGYSGGNSYSPSHTCVTDNPDLRQACQSTIDQGGMTKISYYDYNIYAAHRNKGGRWIDGLQVGQQTQYGKVTSVTRNATGADAAKQGYGNYLQTCDANGNAVLVRVE